MLRDLGWLGHVDIETSTTHRAKNWSIIPPVLSITGPVSAVLAGFRRDALVENIRLAVEDRGGELIVKPPKNSPAVIRVEGIDVEQLTGLAAGLVDPHGRPCAVRMCRSLMNSEC